jgi:hypothetical protein
MVQEAPTGLALLFTCVLHPAASAERGETSTSSCGQQTQRTHVCVVCARV